MRPVAPDRDAPGRGGQVGRDALSQQIEPGRVHFQVGRARFNVPLSELAITGEQRPPFVQRRTNDDKRRAVMVLLNDPEWSKWSDREIARQAGVSQPFVSKLRPTPSDNGYQMDDRTVTRNGTTYQQNTANIGGGSRADQEPKA